MKTQRQAPTPICLGQRFQVGPSGRYGPLQRRVENGLRDTVATLQGGLVTELALPTCCGGLCSRVAQQGFTALATFFWAAVDLHAAVMPRICGELGRPILWAQPDSELAMAVKADMPTAGVAVDLHSVVQFELEAKATYTAESVGER